jgi:transposase
MIHIFMNIISCHGGHDNGQTFTHGGVLGNHRTVTTITKTSTKRRTTAYPQPQSLYRYSLCSQNRYSLGGSPQRDGMRKRNDLLAPITRLAESGCMGQTPSYLIEPTPGCRADQLVTSGYRQCFCAGHFWGAKIGPNPTDRRKNGSKHHTITDAKGIPLAVRLSGANRHDVTQLLPLVDAIPPVSGKCGRPRQRPDIIQGDRAYDSQPHREALRCRGIIPLLARRYTEGGSGLGVTRWVVERTLSWIHQFRRLRLRYERRADIHEAFMTIGCCVICWRFLQHGFC